MRGAIHLYRTVHSKHAHMIRRVVNEQVTESKNSAHVEKSSLDGRSFANHKATGGLSATDCWIFGSSQGSICFRDPLVYEFNNNSTAVVIK